MSLFTRKGDDGTTGTFGCNQRMSKSSATAEALGSLDEINSYLGFVKIRSRDFDFKVPDGRNFSEIINEVQQNLFIIQAETAGADKKITEEKVKKIETIIDEIEKELPPIKSFFVSGGTELSSTLDFSRTLVRRAERRVVEAHENKVPEISEYTLAYMNRLSRLMYALARLSKNVSGITEEPPHYQ